MNKDEKQFQKKVIKLCNAIKRCNSNDLILFVALIMIRFEILDNRDDIHHARLDESSRFETACELSYTLNSEDNVHYLLS